MSNTDSTTPPEQSAVPSAPATGSAVPAWFTVSKDNPTQLGHLWGQRHGWDDWEVCLHCMIIRRRDRRNVPCKGGSALRDLEPPNDELTHRRD